MKPPKFRIGGIIQRRDLARIGLLGVPKRSGTAGAILTALGNRGINCAFIVQVGDAEKRDSIVLCVAQSQLEAALDILKAVSDHVGAEAMVHGNAVAMLAIFGPHFGERPGIAGAMFTALAAAGINTLAISTSVSTISCLINAEQLDDAIQVLQEAFLPPRASC
jgi:aspartate kinase